MPHSTLPLPKSADVVVIGGGVTGSSIAYHLTQRGIRDVVLLERGPLASGVTGRSGAQLIPRSEHPVVAKLKWEGVKFYRAFEEKHGASVDLRLSGYLAVANQHEEKAFTADQQLMASLGSRCRQIGHAEIGDICPAVSLADDEIALTIPEAGFTDPVAVVQALLRIASQDGARVYEYMPAAIRVKGDSIASVLTGDGEIETKAVVVASGVWSNELLTPIGAGVPIYWHRAEVSFYRRPGDVADHPIIGDFVQRFYFRPEQGGLTMAGSIPMMSTGVAAPRGLERVPHPDSMADGVKAETMQSLLDKLTVRIPRFEDGYWRRGHACVYDVTPDWHPVFSFEHNTRGLFVAAGFSGHGFVMSPAAGRLTAEAVAGVNDSRADVHPFRPQRFAEGEPVSFAIG